MIEEEIPLAGADLAGRILALREAGMLDTPAEAVFDRLTRMVVQILRVPISLISLVESKRQFFKSQCGLTEPWASLRETPLTHSFCQYVVMSEKPLAVSDARRHPLLRENLAIPDLGVVAYLGVPLTTAEGFVLGTLCAIDSEAREWTDEDHEILGVLAAQVVTEIELRRAVRSLDRALADARRSETDRGYAVNLFVHDLRTPLTSLLLTLGMLPLTGELSERQRHFLSLAETNGRVVAEMLENLLDIQNTERLGRSAIVRKDCAPGELANRALEQVAGLAARGAVVLGSEIAENPGTVFVDPDLLVRVLVNLLGNAIKFTPKGGTVTVSAGPEDSGSMAFRVRDTGAGMLPEEAEGIFEEGVRGEAGEAAMRSTGLGLTFCKRVVEAHGGRIGFESEAGAGSVFGFSIPRSP